MIRVDEGCRRVRSPRCRAAGSSPRGARRPRGARSRHPRRRASGSTTPTRRSRSATRSGTAGRARRARLRLRRGRGDRRLQDRRDPRRDLPRPLQRPPGGRARRHERALPRLGDRRAVGRPRARRRSSSAARFDGGERYVARLEKVAADGKGTAGMADRLRALHDAGAVGLDRPALARARPLGRAAAPDRRGLGHRPDLEPVDLPEGDLALGRLRRPDPPLPHRDRRPARDLLRARDRGRPRRLRRLPAGLRRERRRRRLRLARGRPGPRRRHGGDGRAGRRPARAGRPAEPLRQDPGDAGGPAGDRGLHRARHPDQRHADLLAGALPRGRRRLPARARAARRRGRRPGAGELGRLVLRLAARHRGRRAARRARPVGEPRAGSRGQARDREREARLPALPRGVRRRGLGAARRRRRASPSGRSGPRPRRRTPPTATSCTSRS